MKLHLPHSLRSAVLACFTTGFALATTLATGVASAAETPVWNLSTAVTSGDYLYDNGTGLFTDNTEVEGTVLNGKNDSNQVQTNISFTLNLTQAKQLTSDTQILKMDMAGDIGLTITATGLATTWGDSTSSSRGSVTWETLESDSGSALFVNADGDTCVTLTFVQSYGSGVQIWNNTTKLVNDGGLKGSSNTSLTSIYADSTYIVALQFTTDWKGDDIVATNAAFAAEAATKFTYTPPAASTAGTFYWEAGSSSWIGNKWATTDGDTSALGGLPTSGTVNVVFNNDETATVTVGDGVSVSSMRVDAGTYTFTGNTDAFFEIAGELSVAEGATADIQTGVMAGSISVAGTLGISGTLDTPTVTIAENGILNLSNSTIDSEIAITNNGTLNLHDSTIESTISNADTVNLSGTINLQGMTGVTIGETIPTASNGFGTVTNVYTVIEGGTSTAANDIVWLINGGAVIDTPDFTDGTLTTTQTGTVYYASVDATTYDGGAVFENATGIALNGATLVIGTEDIADNFITATTEGGEIDLDGYHLAQDSLGVLEGSVILKGNADSVYDLGTSTALAQNLTLSSTDWAGTVKMGNITSPSSTLDISSMGCNGTSIQLGKVNVQSLTSSSQAAVTAQSLILGGDSSVKGDLSVAGALTLGNAFKTAALTVDGTLSAAQGITLGNAGSSVTVGTLAGSSINISADKKVLAALSYASQGNAITLLTVTKGDASGITALLNGEITKFTPGDKYINKLSWNGNKLQLSSKANEDFVTELIAPTSENGKAGASILGSLHAATDPENKAPNSTAAAVLRAVDAALVTEKNLAAIAGSSVTAIGMALSGDVDRQLKAIRNRTTTMGVDQSMTNDTLPYLNAWINAEGSRNEMDSGNTTPGYTLDSWGGTVGFDADLSAHFSMGMALTAMYGDLTVDGPDRIEGDMDTYYVSFFGRYSESSWTHTFVATVGKMDTALDRTVSYTAGSYTTKDNADGMSYGLMYELGYVFAVDEESETCVQPVLNIALRHTCVDSYTEKGSDMALKVGEQNLTTCTLGFGARIQSVVGESAYNRSSLFEARILGKADFGDECSEAEVGFAAGGKRTNVRSEEIGTLGIEVGAGLIIPIGDDDGAIFMDASLEQRSSYTNVNGTLGYRINF